MSYYRNFSPNPNSTDATLTSPTATSPTPSINDFSSKFYDNNNNININQTDNLKMSSSVSNSITNNNVFLTLKFAYSPTGELVIDMEPTNTNSSDTGLSNQQWPGATHHYSSPHPNHLDLTIRHEASANTPLSSPSSPSSDYRPLPPIIIRQTTPAIAKQSYYHASPLVIREKPPRAPELPPTSNQIISVPGKLREPPMRQVIIERIHDAPPPPHEVIIEKWLDYPTPTRNVIHQYAQNANDDNNSNKRSVKNLIIDWEYLSNNGKITPSLAQKINYLGVETVDPVEYERKHGDSLVEQSQLASFINDLNIQVPNGERLATTNSRQIQKDEFVFTGDVKALELLEGRQDLLDSAKAFSKHYY